MLLERARRNRGDHRSSDPACLGTFGALDASDPDALPSVDGRFGICRATDRRDTVYEARARRRARVRSSVRPPHRSTGDAPRRRVPRDARRLAGPRTRHHCRRRSGRPVRRRCRQVAPRGRLRGRGGSRGGEPRLAATRPGARRRGRRGRHVRCGDRSRTVGRPRTNRLQRRRRGQHGRGRRRGGWLGPRRAPPPTSTPRRGQVSVIARRRATQPTAPPPGASSNQTRPP